MVGTESSESVHDVVVVGAGAAGVGAAVALKHAGIDNFVVSERHTVGTSFASWPAETRFITPSFPTNSIGMLDLNSIAIGTSPAFSLGVEHPTGEEYAMYLRGVAQFFELPIRQNTDVQQIAKVGRRLSPRYGRRDLASQTRHLGRRRVPIPTLEWVCLVANCAATPRLLPAMKSLTVTTSSSWVASRVVSTRPTTWRIATNECGCSTRVARGRMRVPIPVSRFPRIPSNGCSEEQFVEQVELFPHTPNRIDHSRGCHV